MCWKTDPFSSKSPAKDSLRIISNSEKNRCSKVTDIVISSLSLVSYVLPHPIHIRLCFRITGKWRENLPHSADKKLNWCRNLLFACIAVTFSSFSGHKLWWRSMRNEANGESNEALILFALYVLGGRMNQCDTMLQLQTREKDGDRERERERATGNKNFTEIKRTIHDNLLWHLFLCSIYTSHLPWLNSYIRWRFQMTGWLAIVIFTYSYHKHNARSARIYTGLCAAYSHKSWHGTWRQLAEKKNTHPETPKLKLEQNECTLRLLNAE